MMTVPLGALFRCLMLSGIGSGVGARYEAAGVDTKEDTNRGEAHHGQGKGTIHARFHFNVTMLDVRQSVR